MSKKTKKPVALNPARAFVYVRVSTDEQHLGPKAQLEACQQYATRNNIEIVQVFEDIGVSGAAPLHECDGLQSAIDSLKAEDVGVLLIAKRDRLARDVMKIGMVTQRVEAAGARVHSADGVPESDEPTAVLMRQILDAFSQFERSLIIYRTKAALRVKKNRSEVVGQTPVGYRRDGKRLVLDEAAVAEVRAAREIAQALVAEGKSYREIVEQFARDGVKYRDVKWKYPAQIFRLLEQTV